MNRYIVQTASAPMPNKVKARYIRVAVIELTPEYAEQGLRPAMISDRAKGVAKIVETWERCHAGRTCGPRTAGGKAIAEATTLAQKLNGAA
jgi:hypothetical protein